MTNPSHELQLPRPLSETHLTISEVAPLLAVTERTLANWRARQVGPPSVRVGNRFWYPRAGVTEYFAKINSGAA